MAGFLSKLLTLGEGKQLKRYEANVRTINGLEAGMLEKSDSELRAFSDSLRERAANGESLDKLLPEAFATMREASRRALGMRHFDVQLIGSMALHEGQIAEMKTGEGKTLVSTLAGYLNSLNGNNVHIVTVNDYLAKRDSEWMSGAYNLLGLEVGLIQNGMRTPQKVPAYKAAVTYGTNSEFGFDYLRDNMVTRAEGRVQRGHHFAIVDEVDSILIDEARTPLIISGAGSQAAELYNKFARVMPALNPEEDFEIDEARRTIAATEVGLAKVEEMLGLDIYNDPSGQLANHLQQALKAQFVFHRDVDYVVADGEVKIVDEFTGRIMEGRRWSEGLHQAVEAKEHVYVREENQTLATITLQNYFRLYEKLSGMTGTAMTEDGEFRQIYNLPVVAIPPNKPVIREDANDLVYQNIDYKFNAVANHIAERHEAGQPVLVGTVSIESSERLSGLLRKRGIKHEILNAKNHAREAHIVAQAGREGAVTIATNMAGRGTDILLGGNPDILMEDFLLRRGLDPKAPEFDEEGNPNPDYANEAARAQALEEARAICAEEHERVLAAGGLCVIGTERHESRRIDNQLRGRSGRQGDPGFTQFYLSLEDDLMRRFGGDMTKIKAMMSSLGEEPIQAGIVSKAIEKAQHNVETQHFGARKTVLEYDDVMNLQRKAIYEERNAILDGKDMSERIPTIISDAVDDAVAEYCPDRSASDEWNIKGIEQWMFNMTGNRDFQVNAVDHDDESDELANFMAQHLMGVYEAKRASLGDAAMDMLQAQVMLRIIDTRWMAHLQEMDYLKTGIHLRAFANRDPLTEYKHEAFQAFKGLTASMYEAYLSTLLRLQVAIRKAEPASASAGGEARGAGGASASSPDLPEHRDPLSGRLSYTSPEATLHAPSAASPAVSGMPNEAPKPIQKASTYVKDKDDPFANCGRNDPCPCGSGKKFKKCHGANL